MPGEDGKKGLNRRLLCNWFWTPSVDANENLVREGKTSDQIVLVGNIMIDSLEIMRKEIEAEGMPGRLGLKPAKYAVATFHRPSNVDEKNRLEYLVSVLEKISADLPLVFPIHPRTLANLKKFDLMDRILKSGIIVLEPLGYKAFMSLVFESGFVLTDSGGIQEETTYLGIPCLTVRANTERPVTVWQGTNTLVDIDDIPAQVEKILKGQYKKGRVPVLWDGHTAQRVVEAMDKIQRVSAD